MDDISWVKLSTDIFDNKKIKQIRKMPEGDSIVLLWVFLICLAGNTNDGGLIYFTREIPYTDEMLSTEFNMDINIVRLGLSVFQKFGMIEIIDDILCLSSWEKYQNVDVLEKIREQTRKRVAKHRDKQRLLLGCDICSYCGNPATGFDHIIPLARGGKDTEENTTPCCIDCNRKKNDKPLVDFLNDNQDIIDNDIVMSNSKLTKYVTRSNVTGRYTVTQCNAIDKDKDIDKDIDIDINKNKKKIIKEKEKESFSCEDMISESECCSSVKEALRTWLQYKHERKEKYTQTGFKMLLSTALKNEKQYGAEAVVETITESMSSQYQGITWDRMKRYKGISVPQTQQHIPKDETPKRVARKEDLVEYPKGSRNYIPYWEVPKGER